MSKLHTNQTKSIEPRPVDGLTPTINMTVQDTVKYLGRPAILCTMSLTKSPKLSKGKRVVSRFWLDTIELELRFITGIYPNVVEFDRKVIANGNILDAQDFARLHLLGEDSK
jgi:hypothetical protein